MSDNEKKDENPIENKSNLKRSSKDFEPDMDSLLITAQSAMIVDGITYLASKNYSSKTLQTYVEAIKGVDLFIKILQRNSKGYSKIQNTIDMDPDSKKVELFAFELYKINYKVLPIRVENKIKAYEILKDKLKSGYYKSIISKSMVNIKTMFLISGGIDTDKIDNYLQSQNIEFSNFIEDLKNCINIAIELLKSHNSEIEKGMKGKDVSIFVINASEILKYYYKKIGSKNEEIHYYNIYLTYKKYFIIK